MDIVLPATDLALLRIVLEQRAIRLDQFPAFLDVIETGYTSHVQRKSDAYNRVERLQRAQLLHMEQLQQGQPAWIWLTQSGANAIGRSISGKAPFHRVLPVLYAINMVRLHVAKIEPRATWLGRTHLRKKEDTKDKKGNNGKKNPRHQVTLPTAELLLPTGERIGIFVNIRLRDTREQTITCMQHILERVGNDNNPYYHALWYYATKEVASTLRTARTAIAQTRQDECARRIFIFAYPLQHQYLYQKHAGSVHALAWSPDGEWLASAASILNRAEYNNEVHIWHATSGEIEARLSPPATTTCIGWSCDGSYLALGDRQGTLSWWEQGGKHGGGQDKQSDRQEPSGAFQLHHMPLEALAWSPQHPDRVATCSTADLALYDVRRNVTLWHVPLPCASVSLAWSPDGKRLAVGGFDGAIRLFDEDGQGRGVLSKHARVCFALAWSSDGRWFASSGEDHLLVIRDARSEEIQHIIRSHLRILRVLAFSADGHMLACGDDKGNVQIWRMRTWRWLQTFREHSDEISGLAWSPDSRRIASASRDGLVLVIPVIRS